jgi:hypothetical protein
MAGQVSDPIAAQKPVHFQRYPKERPSIGLDVGAREHFVWKGVSFSNNQERRRMKEQ